MSYTETDPLRVLNDIRNGSVPDEALTDEGCWKHICTVRAGHIELVRDEDWKELCRRRGALGCGKE